MTSHAYTVYLPHHKNPPLARILAWNQLDKWTSFLYRMETYGVLPVLSYFRLPPVDLCGKHFIFVRFWEWTCLCMRVHTQVRWYQLPLIIAGPRLSPICRHVLLRGHTQPNKAHTTSPCGYALPHRHTYLYTKTASEAEFHTVNIRCVTSGCRGLLLRETVI